MDRRGKSWTFTVPEAATRIGVSDSTVRRMIAKGEIATVSGIGAPHPHLDHVARAVAGRGQRQKGSLMGKVGSGFMSVDELAELTGVSAWSIYESVKETGEAMAGVPAARIRSRVVISRKLVEDVMAGRTGLDA